MENQNLKPIRVSTTFDNVNGIPHMGIKLEGMPGTIMIPVYVLMQDLAKLFMPEPSPIVAADGKSLPSSVPVKADAQVLPPAP